MIFYKLILVLLIILPVITSCYDKGETSLLDIPPYDDSNASGYLNTDIYVFRNHNVVIVRTQE